MTRETAEKIMRELCLASRALNESTLIVQSECSETFFLEYRRQAAEIMAAIYLDLIKRVVKPYPDLDPGRDENGDGDGEA